MGKLHELLAVERDLKLQSEKIRGDLKGLFKDKRHHFTGLKRIYTPLLEGAPSVEEESTEVQTTVLQELEWAKDFLAKQNDVIYKIDVANMEAKADVVIDGKPIMTAVPATHLLQLEKRIIEWRDLAALLPTLDPVKGFKPDPEHGAGHYRAREERRPRTEKRIKAMQKAPPTKEHAEQAELINIDEKVGEVTTIEWSGLIHPSQKAAILTNIETLLRAVKRARARANEVAVKDAKVTRPLLDFAFQLAPAPVEEG